MRPRPNVSKSLASTAPSLLGKRKGYDASGRRVKKADFHVSRRGTEKIYSLMAQAEDMQAHAEKLQNGAEKTFAGLPLAVEQAGQKIRSTTLLGALFVLAVGVVVSSVAVAGV